MRTLCVVSAVLIAATCWSSPVGADPYDPNGIGLSADHTATCSGVTIVTEGWPDGSSGVLGINGVGYTIPMGGSSPLTGTWATDGATYGYTIWFQVPGQVPGAEGATVYCPGGVESSPVPVAVTTVTTNPQPVVEVDAASLTLGLPATL